MFIFESIGNFFRSFFGNPVIQAILLLLLAWVVAIIARAIVTKLLNRYLAKKASSTPEEVRVVSGDTVRIIGNIVFAVVFLLFLPGALDKLGLNSVTAPLSGLATRFLSFLPNIVAAVILIAFGFFLARLASQLLSRFLKKTKLDSFQIQCGIQPRAGSEFSDIIAKIAYALILIIFVVAGIQVLNISAISNPATEMVSTIFHFIPLLFAAIVLIAFGIFLGNLIGNLVRSILGGTGLDTLSATTYQLRFPKAAPLSRIIGYIVTAVIDIIFVVAGIKILGIEVLSNVGTAIIGYLPSLLAACIVLVAAWAAATLVQKLITKSYPKATSLALLVKVLIMVLAGFMAVSQLGISKDITDTLFKWICIGGAAAFALAFGLGGREWAKTRLEKISGNIDDQLSETAPREEPAEAEAAPAGDPSADEVPDMVDPIGSNLFKEKE